MKRAGRIIINIGEGITHKEAIDKVQTVVNAGRISDDGKCYCYLSVSDLVFVVASRNKQGTDTFHVYKEGSYEA
jgi:hypothetical protein